MPKSRIAICAVLASGLLTLPGAGEVRAEGIECEGNFQIVEGRRVASGYCRDRYLARVARSYGIRVSAETLRRSESKKGEVCRAIGFDNRVAETCAPYMIGRSQNQRPR
jgi:hypothetical protein